MKKTIISTILLASMITSVFAFGGCGSDNKDEYEGDKLVISLAGHEMYTLQSASMTEDSKRIMSIIEDKLKIKLDVSTAPYSSYMDMLSPKIATNQTPDMFIHFKDTESYLSWVEEDILMDYGSYLETGNYPHLSQMFTMLDSDANVVKHFLGGGYYSYPIVLHTDQESGELSVEIAMYYRLDWYNALKNKGWQPSSNRELKDPQDADFNYLNFYDLMEGYTYGDPDGNGQQDTYGYGFTKDLGVYWWYPILNMFDGYNWDGWYQDDNGKWQPECISDTMKEAVMFIADMYDNGLINEQYSTTTTFEMMKNDFCNGKSGCISYNVTADMAAGVADMMSGYIGKVPNGKAGGGITTEPTEIIKGMPVITGTDGMKHIQGAKNNFGYLAINNDISETKKLKILELMEYLLSEEGEELTTWGLEGTHWEYEADGVTKKSLLKIEGEGYKRQQYLLYNNTVAPATYRLKGLVSWHTVDTNDPRQFPEVVDQLRTAWSIDDLFVDELALATVPASMATTKTRLEDKIASYYKSIVAKQGKNMTAAQNRSAREDLWAEFVAYYNDNGQEYINAVNAAAQAIGK